MDHTWDTETMLHGEVRLGWHDRPFTLHTYAPDAFSFALTGYLCALSLNTGMSKGFKLSYAWMRRAAATAERVEASL